VKVTQCPKCDAELPRRGRFCLECGCDLYEEGVRRRAVPWLPILLGLGIAGGLVAVLAALFHTPAHPPEESLVRELSTEFLRLAAERKYGDIVTRFYQPNATEFDALDETLKEVVRGAGTRGLNLFRATCMDNHAEAEKFVNRFGTRHPAYVVRVLTGITFQDGDLRTSLGGTLIGAQRAESFCAWHLGLAFEGVDAAAARVAEIRWEDGPAGERLLVATIEYPERPEPMPGLADLSVLRWRQLRPGVWVLSLGGRLGLDEVLELLKRVSV
jgi:hypothetical protein